MQAQRQRAWHAQAAAAHQKSRAAPVAECSSGTTPTTLGDAVTRRASVASLWDARRRRSPRSPRPAHRFLTLKARGGAVTTEPARNFPRRLSFVLSRAPDSLLFPCRRCINSRARARRRRGGAGVSRASRRRLSADAERLRARRRVFNFVTGGEGMVASFPRIDRLGAQPGGDGGQILHATRLSRDGAALARSSQDVRREMAHGARDRVRLRGGGDRSSRALAASRRARGRDYLFVGAASRADFGRSRRAASSTPTRAHMPDVLVTAFYRLAT